MNKLTLVLLMATLMVGCGTMRQHCSYYKNGVMSDYRVRSAVLGTGETEMVSTDCAVAAYSTRDTGLSNNGKEALSEIAKGVVMVTPVGAGADVLKEGIEALDDDPVERTWTY